MLKHAYSAVACGQYAARLPTSNSQPTTRQTVISSPSGIQSLGTRPPDFYLVPTTGIPSDSSPMVQADSCTLPEYTVMADPNFTWGSMDATTFISELGTAYNEIVHWRMNSFNIQRGKAGKTFTNELACLFLAVALKAATVLPILTLQKPSRKSKPKDHNACLERRMKLWEKGDINELVREGRAIQSRLPKHQSQLQQQQLARSFARLREGPSCSAVAH